MSNESEVISVIVPVTAKQTGEARSSDWVERSIWTDRMLEALVKGVKGGVWFSLIDKVYRPSTLQAAWQAVCRIADRCVSFLTALIYRAFRENTSTH